MAAKVWSVYQLIDQKFSTASAAKTWLKKTFGTTEINHIDWLKLQEELVQLPNKSGADAKPKKVKPLKAGISDRVIKVLLESDVPLSAEEVAEKTGLLLGSAQSALVRLKCIKAVKMPIKYGIKNKSCREVRTVRKLQKEGLM